MNIPSQIRAGDTVKWRDDPAADNFGNPITSTASWTLNWYLRFNKNNEGITVSGVAYQSGWQTTISASTSATFDAGEWYWQAIAVKGSEKFTLGAGQLRVLPALEYIGSPVAFDGRTQLEIDLDAVQAAIRTLISGGAVKQYSIGGRSLTKYELKDLLALESQLKAQVKREQAAQLQANGLGNPHNLFVRF